MTFASEVSSGPKIARKTKKPEDHEGGGADLVAAEETKKDLPPTDACGRRLALAPSGGGWGTRARSAVIWATTQSLLPGRADPRIEPAIEQVGDQIRDHDRDRDHQEDTLHQRVIARLNGLEEGVADPLVLEDRLDQKGTADDEADRDRQLGEERQNGVAADVADGDPALSEAARPRRGDEVFLDGGDGAALHQQHPGPETGQRIGENRQRGVVERIPDEGEAELQS